MTADDDFAPPAFAGDFGGLRCFVDGDPAELRVSELRVFLPGDDFAKDVLDRVLGGFEGAMARSGGRFRKLE